MTRLSQKVLSEKELAQLSADAEVLERDTKGIKVLRLNDGNILKFFRVKRWWSGACIYPYSARFCRNAIRLHEKNVRSIEVIAYYKLMSPGLTAVLYRPLLGRTLRDIARISGLQKPLIQSLAKFVFELHQQGIYFRSLHLGNIVQTPEGNLGLIDIADMQILPFPLLLSRRLRNFRHLSRLKGDRELFGEKGWDLLLETYTGVSHWPENKCEKFATSARKIFTIAEIQ